MQWNEHATPVRVRSSRAGLRSLRRPHRPPQRPHLRRRHRSLRLPLTPPPPPPSPSPLRARRPRAGSPKLLANTTRVRPQVRPTATPTRTSRTGSASPARRAGSRLETGPVRTAERIVCGSGCVSYRRVGRGEGEAVSRPDRDSNDRVEEIRKLAPLDRHRQWHAQGQLPTIRIRLDLVSLQPDLRQSAGAGGSGRGQACERRTC